MRDRGVNACLAQCLNSVLNVKAVVAALNHVSFTMQPAVQCRQFVAPLPSRIIALDISYLYHGILAGLGGSSIAALPKLDKMTRDNPCRGPGPGLGLT